MTTIITGIGDFLETVAPIISSLPLSLDDDLNDVATTLTVGHPDISLSSENSVAYDHEHDHVAIDSAGLSFLADTRMSYPTAAHIVDNEMLADDARLYRASYSYLDKGFVFNSLPYGNFPSTTDEWMSGPCQSAEYPRTVVVDCSDFKACNIVFDDRKEGPIDPRECDKSAAKEAIVSRGLSPFFALGVNRGSDTRDPHDSSDLKLDDYYVIFCAKPKSAAGPFVGAPDMFKLMPRIMSGLYYDNDFNWITGYNCRLDLSYGVRIVTVDDIVGRNGRFYDLIKSASSDVSRIEIKGADDYYTGTLFGGLWKDIRHNNKMLNIMKRNGRDDDDGYVEMSGPQVNFNDFMLLSVVLDVDDYDDPSVRLIFAKNGGVPRTCKDWKRVAEDTVCFDRAAVIVHRPDREEVVYDTRGLGLDDDSSHIDAAFKVIEEKGLIPFIVQGIEGDEFGDNDDYESACAIYCVEDWNVLSRELTDSPR